MTPLSFSLVFSLALIASVLVKLWLALRQIRHVARHSDRVPAGFENRIDAGSHARAARYTIARVRLGMLETLVAATTLLGLTLLGGLQLLNQLLHLVLPDTGLPDGLTDSVSPHAGLFEPGLLRALLLILVVSLLVSIIDLPLAAWRQFVLEKRFGFNRMTPALFLSDLLRGALLTLLLGGPLLALILWLMTAIGEGWWLAAWGVWLVFNGLVLVLYPVLIAPLFNRFEPLAEGEVSTRLQTLLARCGFAARGLFVMDGSRRSAHGNAYFTGLGRHRRIVLFDTLLERLDADEIEAVLAHELGHFKRRHLLQRVIMSFGLSLGGLALMGWLAQQAWFFQGLGLTPEPGDHAGGLALLLFFLALPPFTFLLRPLGSALSRRHEREADDYAVQQTGARPLARALVKLYRDNASTLTPDPLHSAFHDSHPPALQRLARLPSA